MRPPLKDSPDRQQPQKAHNPFINNLYKNVNRAFDYDPEKEDRPIYRF